MTIFTGFLDERSTNVCHAPLDHSSAKIRRTLTDAFRNVRRNGTAGRDCFSSGLQVVFCSMGGVEMLMIP